MSVRLVRRAVVLAATVPLALIAAPVGTAAGGIAAAPRDIAAAPAVAPVSGHTTVRPRAAAITPKTATNKWHPFSDPVRYPLAVEAKLDCVRSNPGCLHGHSTWSMDQTPTLQWKYGPSRAKVLAMGAGVLHIKTAHGSACGHGSNFGTEVWIDHGGGVISRYGHLSKILVRSGQYVAAGQAVGVVGDTGKNVNCGRVNYTDYGVKHHGYQGIGVQLKSLKACAARAKAVSYPSAVTRYTVWNKVHQGTIIARPAGGTSCMSTAAAPATASAATGLALTKSGRGVLTVRWARPAAKFHVGTVLIEVALYHSNARRYDYAWDEKYLSVAPSHTSYTIKGLSRGAKYRVRVEFHNSVGWSHYGTWLTRSA